MPIVYYQSDINSIIFQLPLIYLVFMFDSIDEIKIMTEPDSETQISTCILKYRYLMGVCLFLLLLRQHAVFHLV